MAGSGTSGQRHGWASAVAALLVCPTHQEAARRAGIGETTLRRWLRDPRFVVLLQRAEAAVIEAAVAQNAGAMSEAVQALRANLADPNPNARNRAAAEILDFGLRSRELQLQARFSELERIVRGMQSGASGGPDRPAVGVGGGAAVGAPGAPPA